MCKRRMRRSTRSDSSVFLTGRSAPSVPFLRTLVPILVKIRPMIECRSGQTQLLICQTLSRMRTDLRKNGTGSTDGSAHPLSEWLNKRHKLRYAESICCSYRVGFRAAQRNDTYSYWLVPTGMREPCSFHLPHHQHDCPTGSNRRPAKR